MNDLFFEFSFFESREDFFELSSECEINSCGAGFADRYLTEFLSTLDKGGRKTIISLVRGIPEDVCKRANKAYKYDIEGYVLSIADDGITLYAESNRGFIYAVSTLKQLSVAKRLASLLIYDRPDAEIRGYRLYTPGKENIDTFKKMIDKLLYYKYNSIILEVGGAMEYDRHPEINTRWKAFCKEVSVSPEAAHKIQHGYWWAKNSIHADNGDGGCISKDEMRDLVKFCREREIEVIP